MAAAAEGGAASVIEAVVGAIGRWTDNAPPGDDETLLVIAHETRAHAGAEREALSPGDSEQLLRQARGQGLTWTLPARMEALEGIGAWLRSCAPASGLSEREIGLLTTALYEVCANIVEHGYREDPSRSLDVGWISDERGETMFLVRDDGSPFAPPPTADLDFGDPSVRSKGRGIGLQIIRRATRQAAYFPGTREGNITVLRFPGSREEAQRGPTP